MKKKTERMPSIRQMLKMAVNLRKEYNRFATVQACTWAHIVGGKEEKIEFWLSVDGIKGNYRNWPETLKEYKRLMNG